MVRPGPSAAEMLANRLRKNERRLSAWRKREGVSCYRVYDRDIPEVPLAIDRYGDHLHIAEYERPHDRTEAQQQLWLSDLCRAAAEALGVPDERVATKLRQRQRGTSQYERTGSGSRRFAVDEGGLRFWVNLFDYLDTGLFLDHRQTRERVRREAAGADVLNLFGYTGAFSVYAAAGGARTTTTVDLSKTYLDWAGENLRLNGYPVGAGANELIRDDVPGAMRSGERPGRRYDLVIVDPPTFSNSKAMERVFDLQRDHVRLLAFAAERTRPGGVIYFSTNHRRFRLDPAALRGLEGEEITDRTVPPDFRNQRIHRCWRLSKKA